ncbi:MAG TPA: ABC transporter ATP-binding protein [Hydrogenophaga sp.]|uniref:ABC transporter ATP-binding protein n=1 Tax=Hydrogenophaga sp. TaxID=1904254 RepID=UPI0008AD8EDA|nr:ABC transporter ATP-binding protein [Hydrogenophaga sp.]OGA74741.1 MAG: ABC transporter ATP-binding protein [Burkholderiales bacterium GWE1_65_30]OGA91848.1 MAG: ABC transporter ATP-binding protein [Burkholderiales bacterium GWF1_66_17]HAX20823.1 ABC transporter ATP-binding protein [Hydrogenophaga sp.]HBU20555.1 ABC transporter ATP-binding protein [Hydrogenophaga sp.]
MHILWKYLRPQRKLVALALLLAAVSQILALVDPIIFGWLIDGYATQHHVKSDEELVRGALLLLGLAVVVALVSRATKAVQEYMTRLVVQRFGTQIFNEGLRQTMRLDIQEFEERRSGETLSLLMRVRADTERFLNAFINVLFASAIGMAFLVWYAVTKSWALVPVFLIGLLVLGGLSGLLSRQIRGQQRSINRETTRNAGFITESLRNVALIKSLGLTFREIRRLEAKTEAVFALEMAKVRHIRWLTFWQGSTLSLLKLSVLFTLLWLIFRDVLSTGELIAMQFIAVAILAPLQELGTVILAWREASSSMSQFAELMARPVDRRPPHALPIGPIESLRFDNVVFRHRGALGNALDGVSFKAVRGDTIAFVGPSGSGKSTLVKLLLGLYRPAEGEVYYNEVGSRNLRYNEARRQVGYVTQETSLFAGTVRENLLFVRPDASDEQILQALAQASCTSLLGRLAQGLDTLIGESGAKLSGGERQRLSIARALLREPRLLIFDEATSALDSITEQKITETMREVSSARTQITLLIAHRLSTVLHADTIYVLEKGRITESGSHADLVEQKGLYYAMWRQQIGERDQAVPVESD